MFDLSPAALDVIVALIVFAVFGVYGYKKFVRPRYAKPSPRLVFVGLAIMVIMAMSVFGVFPPVLDGIVSLIVAVALYVFIYKNYVQPRFPKVTPWRFVGIMAGILIAVMAVFTVLSRNDSYNCMLAQTSISLTAKEHPVAGKNYSPEEREQKLQQSCEWQARICKGETKPSIDELCGPYRTGQDAS